MKASIRNQFVAAVLFTQGAMLGGAGIAVGHADDAPGAGLIGILLFLAFAFAAFRAAKASGRADGREGATH